MPNLVSWLTIREVFDLLLVAGGIYFILFFIKQSRSYVLAYAVGFFTAIIFIVWVFDLSLARQLLQIFGTLFLFVFVVVFQRELRQFFDWVFISTRRLTSPRAPALSAQASFSLVKAIQEMAQKKIGALLILPGELPLEGVVEGGFNLDGRISLPLLLSIFDVTSPGHDGAIIIDNNRVRKFGVHLPLAENYSGLNRTGTRHRAGVGVTEKSDALAIIVSQERGEISVAEHGQLEKIDEPHLLEERISQFVNKAQEQNSPNFWQVLLLRNWRLEVLALILAIILRLVV
ncbi:MAG: DNA integrity scanning protein DisA nucleotide-binding domain protein [Candidatus Paceibacterota bacterium]|jgi:uncharacterized protein (TIGR00159 family)